MNSRNDRPPEVAESSPVAVRKRTVLSDEWTRLERLELSYRRRDGEVEPQIREVYHRAHGASVLLIDVDRRCVVLVRQFRVAAWEVEKHRLSEPGFLLEVPAGNVDDEDPAAAICREAWEETGIRIDAPRFLFAAYATPGAVTEQVYYFEARYTEADKLGAGGGLDDEGEDIEVVEIGIDEAWALVERGEIRDAKTILLLQHARLGPLSAS